MPQLRQNIISGEWVVIAPERAKRPNDFVVAADSAPHDPTTCPFCPNTEAHQHRLEGADTAHTFTIPNKFPAFVTEGHHEVRSYLPEGELYQAKPAVGAHEVIIINETDRLPTLPPEVLTDLFLAIQNRYKIHHDDPAIAYVMAIYNHGQAAGASISHPHAQLFASSIVPNHILKEKHGSEHYYELNGSCVYCDMITHEQTEKVRILAENDDFLMFNFFAARFPFEIWILPKTHQSNFESLPSAGLANLGAILHEGLTMLDTTLKDPALNFYIHSLPTTSDSADYYHWHLEIAPRVATYGGYEMGSGVIIDVVSPEKATQFLKGEDDVTPPETNL